MNFIKKMKNIFKKQDLEIKKNQEEITRIYSPVIGQAKTLESLNDGVFSEKMVGEGIAIIPTDNHFYAPFDGEISIVYPTGHAYGIVASDNTNVLIHIGINTVNIKEDLKVFDSKVVQGQKVKKGDLLAIANFEEIKKLGYSIETVIVVTNDSPKPAKIIISNEKIDNNSIIIEVK